VSFYELDGDFLGPGRVEAEFDLAELALAERLEEQIRTEFWDGATWVGCGILYRGWVGIDIAKRGLLELLLLLLVLWMGGRSDGMGSPFAGGRLCLGRRRRRERGRTR
jgi:hypothetical protein